MELKAFSLPEDPDMKKLTSAVLTSAFCQVAAGGVAPEKTWEAVWMVYTGILNGTGDLAMSSSAVLDYLKILGAK
jgi:hypothetical protein